MTKNLIKNLIENTAMYKLFDKHFPNGAWLESKQLADKIVNEIDKKKSKDGTGIR